MFDIFSFFKGLLSNMLWVTNCRECGKKQVKANRLCICKIDVLALDIFETKRFIHGFGNTYKRKATIIVINRFCCFLGLSFVIMCHSQ